MPAPAPLYRIVALLGGSTGPLGRETPLAVIFAGTLAAYVLATFIFSIVVPGYGYDLVPYIGAALQVTGSDAVTLHREAWGALSATAPPDIYQALSDNGDTYRQRQSSDAAAFASVLPLYSVKIAYTALLGLSSDASGMVPLAHWASRLSGLVIGLTALFWLWQARALHAAPLVIAALMTGGFHELMRSPGPDVIASALVLAGLFIWMRGGVWSACGLFLVAFLFRPDTLVLLIALTMAAFLMRLERLAVVITLAAALVASWLIQDNFSHPGWWTHYYFSNVQLQPTLEGFDEPFGVLAWAKGFARGIYMSVTQFNWPAALIITLVALFALFKTGAAISSRQAALLLAMVLTIGGKFALFPLPDDRLYSIFIVAMVLTIADIWKPNLAWRN